MKGNQMYAKAWRVLVFAGAAALCAAVVLVVVQKSEPRALAVAPIKGSTGRPQLTRVQVDLFELKCSAEQLLKLDMMALGNTESGPMKASPEQLLQRLSQLGEARLAIRYDNFVDLVGGTRLNTGKSFPTVREISINASGVIVPSVAYQDVGFTVDLKGAWLDESEPNLAFVDFMVESSGPPTEKVDIGMIGKDTRLNLPVYDQFQSRQRVVARQGLPVLLACNDLSKVHQNGEKVSVLVARLVATRLIE
jgi:hypothetical protein